jgi:dimethylargininase
MTSSSGNLPLARRATAALVSAVTVAAIAHVVTVLAFFVAGGANTESLSQVSDYFLVATLFAFILLAVVAALDGLRRWYVAVPAAIVVAGIASLLGTVVTLVTSRTPIDAATIGPLLGTLLGPSLVYIVAFTVAAGTIGRRVWFALAGTSTAADATGSGRVALVRAPAQNLAEGQVTHIERTPIDADLAEDQWDGYLQALIDNGWEPVEVTAAPAMPDSVFIEDAVVMFDDTAVITSPGAESRRGETAAVEDAVRDLGLTIRRIELPGTLDGGDVLKVGRTVYVGRGGRTNAEGIRQLRTIVTPLGFAVVAVPTTKVLHLKSAVTALPDGTVIGYPPLVDDPAIFDRFLAVPEEAGAHVVVLAADTVLMAASAPKSAALIADLGYRVVPVDISEFEKLEGCVTCLSVRVR